MKFLAFLFLLSLIPASASAQYNIQAARSAPSQQSTVVDNTGQSTTVVSRKPATKNRHGNAAGANYDLAVDGAFDGQTIAVLHLYTGGGFDFEAPRKALAEKGFSVYRWRNAAPSPAELKKQLEKACQLWVISGMRQQLTKEHVAVIKEFFESGRGIYLWGDNAPYHGDANIVANALFGSTMKGSVRGEQIIGMTAKSGPGIIQDHLLTTGIEQIYEGHTIGTLSPSKKLKPLIRGSAGNLVASYHDEKGRRAIFDGGFTRLYIKWDTAGTGRYVKNAAAWLTNYERFGDAVVGSKYHKKINN